MWSPRVVLLGCLLGSCASAPKSWHVERVMDAGEKLGGCAAGDVLPDRPGLELVAVAASGAVWVAWRDGGSWRSEKAFTAPGEMIQVACGEVLTSVPGDEIVAVGMARGPETSAGPGAAWLIYRRGDRWHTEQIAESPRLIHGVCVAREGVVVTGFTNEAKLIRFGGGRPRPGSVVALPGAGKTGLQVGNRVVIACNDGTLAAIDWSDDSVIHLDKRDAGRARLGSDGERIAVADDDGTLSIVTASGRNEVHKETEKLRGAVLADVDPDADGIEAACAGYENKITVLRTTPDGWRAELVHRASDRLHHLLAAQIDGAPGMELVACGYAGVLIVITRR